MSSTIAAVDHVPDAPAIVEFGRFKVVPHRRELLDEGRPIELGGRAFDVLIALVEASGTVVSKDELMRRVWAGRIVEENTLQGAISALRKAFGADRALIRTVAGRGYQFTGEIRSRSAGDSDSAAKLRGICCRNSPTGSGSPSSHRCPIPNLSRLPSPPRSG